MDEPSLPDESIFLQALEIPSAPERAAYVELKVVEPEKASGNAATMMLRGRYY